jgi:integrase
MDTNPELASRQHSHERKRERLAIESYRIIRDHAPERLRNAMDLSLLTSLRREDVVLLRFADMHDSVRILPEQLSRAFADARDAAGITGDNPPAFHEIRSLGAALLRQSSWSEKQVQELLTHTDAAMTKLNLPGHEQPRTEASATGSLPR